MTSSNARGEVTHLLRRWQEEKLSVGDALVAAVQPELEKIARRSLRRERGDHTLETQALVNEAYMALVDQNRVQWAGRAHFYAIAAQSMRRILVDHARRKSSRKRGGEVVKIAFEESSVAGEQRGVDLLDLDEALHRLAARDQVKGQIVELRFFGGFSHPQIAEILGISLTTVERHWRMARAWLFDALDGSGQATAVNEAV